MRRDYGSVTPLILSDPGRQPLKKGVRHLFKKSEFRGRVSRSSEDTERRKRQKGLKGGAGACTAVSAYV